MSSIPDTREPDDVFVYADPPYVKMGAACYRQGVDHGALAETLFSLSDTGFGWLLSYDDCVEVRKMYSGCRFEPLTVSYSNNGRTRGKATEALIMPRRAG